MALAVFIGWDKISPRDILSHPGYFIPPRIFYPAWDIPPPPLPPPSPPRYFIPRDILPTQDILSPGIFYPAQDILSHPGYFILPGMFYPPPPRCFIPPRIFYPARDILSRPGYFIPPRIFYPAWDVLSAPRIYGSILCQGLITSLSLSFSLHLSSELDLGVFVVLEYGPISRTLLDTDENTKDREELRLMPQQLCFLLHDLCHKLTNSLSHFGSRGLSGGKVSSFTFSFFALEMVFVAMTAEGSTRCRRR